MLAQTPLVKNLENPQCRKEVEYIFITRHKNTYPVSLQCQVLGVSRNRARKLMWEAGVQVHHRKKHKVTTSSNHKQPVFDNLVKRQFAVAQSDQVYAIDTTYI